MIILAKWLGIGQYAVQPLHHLEQGPHEEAHARPSTVKLTGVLLAAQDLVLAHPSGFRLQDVAQKLAGALFLAGGRRTGEDADRLACTILFESSYRKLFGFAGLEPRLFFLDYSRQSRYTEGNSFVSTRQRDMGVRKCDVGVVLLPRLVQLVKLPLIPVCQSHILLSSSSAHPCKFVGPHNVLLLARTFSVSWPYDPLIHV
jgi:hypothetical protein